MAKMSKKYAAASALVDRDQKYTLDEAVALVKKTATANFDESVDMVFNLNIDPKYADQQIRGAMVLPHGTGKTKKVLVFAKGAKVDEAEQAGADYVGGEELLPKIQGGWFDFDVVIATPDMMAIVGRLGKVLGPKGLMPNPKVGTVTMDVAKAIGEVKAGKIEYRADKAGNIQVSIGKASFGDEQLAENARAIFDRILKARPSTVKGQYMKTVTLSATMGPGVRLDQAKMAAPKE